MAERVRIVELSLDFGHRRTLQSHSDTSAQRRATIDPVTVTEANLGPRLVVAAPDKLRGTLSAAEAVAAISAGAARAGWGCIGLPMADGGEGFVAAIAGGEPGAVMHAVAVHGPLGALVEAAWAVLSDGTAVVEMAQASGLLLAGGAGGNDALAATTKGTGELIAAAIEAGATSVLVGLGGSATTDGGLGAIDVLVRRVGVGPAGCLPPGVDLVIACDVETQFVEAARVYGPQKGATPAQAVLLERRLRLLAARYQRRFGVDVTGLAGGGAAGGLAGGLAAIGGRIVPGFDVVATALGLAAAVRRADLVVTAEGRLDATSFAGKTVGGVCRVAAGAGVGVLVIAGEVAPDLALPAGVTATDLSDIFGADRAHNDPAGCIVEVVAAALA